MACLLEALGESRSGESCRADRRHSLAFKARELVTARLPKSASSDETGSSSSVNPFGSRRFCSPGGSVRPGGGTPPARVDARTPRPLAAGGRAAQPTPIGERASRARRRSFCRTAIKTALNAGPSSPVPPLEGPAFTSPYFRLGRPTRDSPLSGGASDPMCHLLLVAAPLSVGLAILAISASVNATVKVFSENDDNEEPLLPGVAAKRAVSTRSMAKSSILVRETGVAYWTAVGMVFLERDRDIYGEPRGCGLCSSFLERMCGFGSNALSRADDSF